MPSSGDRHCEEHFTERNEAKQISTLSVYNLAVQTIQNEALQVQ